LVVSQRLPARQVPPGQQGWPAIPQSATQVPAWQALFASVQVVPPQQDSPTRPQFWQVPLMQLPFVQPPPAQQGCPTVPQGWQPSAWQESPGLQVPFGQQNSPGNPQ
jgi:hypothetical protein